MLTARKKRNMFISCILVSGFTVVPWSIWMSTRETIPIVTIETKKISKDLECSALKSKHLPLIEAKCTDIAQSKQ